GAPPQQQARQDVAHDGVADRHPSPGVVVGGRGGHEPGEYIGGLERASKEPDSSSQVEGHISAAAGPLGTLRGALTSDFVKTFTKSPTRPRARRFRREGRRFRRPFAPARATSARRWGRPPSGGFAFPSGSGWGCTSPR